LPFGNTKDARAAERQQRTRCAPCVMGLASNGAKCILNLRLRRSSDAPRGETDRPWHAGCFAPLVRDVFPSFSTSTSRWTVSPKLEIPPCGSACDRLRRGVLVTANGLAASWPRPPLRDGALFLPPRPRPRASVGRTSAPVGLSSLSKPDSRAEGDSHLLCEAPSRPFRQKGGCHLFCSPGPLETAPLGGWVPARVYF
jgi:hypothetical protein